jgi:hypothetical protein
VLHLRRKKKKETTQRKNGLWGGDGGEVRRESWATPEAVSQGRKSGPAESLVVNRLDSGRNNGAAPRAQQRRH